MAQKIYDENGKCIGTVKSEQEAADDDLQSFIENIGCLAGLIGVVLAVFAVGIWCVVFSQLFEGEIEWLLFIIPIPVVTFFVGKKVIANKRSLWGCVWRVFLVDGVLALMLALISGNKFKESLFPAATFAILPTVIVALVVYIKMKKK